MATFRKWYIYSLEGLFKIKNITKHHFKAYFRSAKTSKSAILDGKKLTLSNQVFRRSRELKIGYFRWKTAVDIKSGVFRNFPISFSCKKSKMATFEKYTFIARKGLFYIKNITKHHFKAYFEEKWREEFSNFGTKIMGIFSLQKIQNGEFSAKSISL